MLASFRYHCFRRDISNFSLLKHRAFVGMLISMHQSGTHWVRHILISAICHEKGFEQPTSIHDEDRFMIDFEDRLVDYIPPGSDKVYIWVKAEC